MGRLVESLRIICEFCDKPSLPLTISGLYLDGTPATLYECPLCGYTRHYHRIGFVELKKRSKRRKRIVKKFPYGRLARKLEDAAIGYRLS